MPKVVRDAERFLSGRSTKVQEELAAQMDQASEEMEFERAAALRDRIRALTQVQTNQGINPRGVTEADVIALHMDGGQACVQVFFIRANQNWGNRDFYPRVGPDVAVGRGDGSLSWPVLRQQGTAPTGHPVRRHRERGSDAGSVVGQGRPQGRHRGPAARREGRTGLGCAAQCARIAWPAGWPKAQPRPSC